MSHSITTSIIRHQAVAAKVTDMMKEEKALKRIRQSVGFFKKALQSVWLCAGEFNTGRTMDMKSGVLWMCQ